MQELLEKLSKVGILNKAELCVNMEQSTAVCLYQNLGFTIVRQEKTQLGDGKKHTELIMEIVLV